ncbi:hypothetical protein OAZ03_02820 [Gammaproteobacteria bacterium]|nr:hypothetical protein [Gammaproteobacteria bacterium]
MRLISKLNLMNAYFFFGLFCAALFIQTIHANEESDAIGMAIIGKTSIDGKLSLGTLPDVESTVLTNQSDIEQNSESIETVQSSVTTNQSDIEQNSEIIETVQSSVSINVAEVNKNVIKTKVNTENILNNTTEIDVLKASIKSLQSINESQLSVQESEELRAIVSNLILYLEQLELAEQEGLPLPKIEPLKQKYSWMERLSGLAQNNLLIKDAFLGIFILLGWDDIQSDLKSNKKYLKLTQDFYNTEILSVREILTFNYNKIIQNADSIGVNTANIASNASGIDALESSMVTAQDNSTNTTDIAANTTTIAANTTTIAANTTTIAANTTTIAANTTSITSAVTNTATNQTNIEINATDIDSLETSVTSLQSGGAARDTLLEGVTAGTVTGGKAIVVDATKDINGLRNLTASGELDAATLDISGNADIDGTLEADAISIDGTTITASAADINLIDGIANGTVTASKAVVVDANKDVSGFRNITLTGLLNAGSLDISGNVDIDGTLEADAISIDGTTITASAADINLIDGITNGTVAANKAVVTDESGNISGFTNITTNSLNANGLVTVGVNDTGYDVKFYGDTSGRYFLWDASADALILYGDLQTATGGTSNFVAGLNAGNSITSGGNYNVAVGDDAGTAITTGDFNTAIGYQSLYSTVTGQYNSAVGYQALLNNTGSENTAMGYQSLIANIGGEKNSAFGHGSLKANTSGSGNTVMGYWALASDTNGSNNVAIGMRAMESANGTDNTAVGTEALKRNSGSYNVAVGHRSQGATSGSGQHNTSMGRESLYKVTGNRNLALGGGAMYNATSADENTAVGVSALGALVTGDYNTALGREALDLALGSNNVGIGYQSGKTLSSGNSNTFLGTLACSDMTAANNFFCFGITNTAGTILAMNASTGNVVLGNNDSGQITLKGDVYITGDLYVAGSTSNSAGDTAVDTPDEIRGNAFAVSGSSVSARAGNVERYSKTSNSPDYQAFNLQLNAVDSRLDTIDSRIDGLDLRFNVLESSIYELTRDFQQGMAMSAAIAATPSPRSLGWSFTAGAGNYASSDALSAGFIYIDDNFSASIGYAKADGSRHSMTNMGVSYNLSSLFRK